MKKKIVSMVTKMCIMLACIMCISTVIPSVTKAAVSWPSISSNKPIKAYTRSVGKNITTYDSKMKKETGRCLYDTDELFISSVSNGKIIYTYPTNDGRRVSYNYLSLVTAVSAPSEVNTAKAKITSYRRYGGGAAAGYIEVGDRVYKLTSQGSWTQVLYNIGSVKAPTGWRMAWIPTSSYNSYIKRTTNPPRNKAEALARVAEGEIGYQGRNSRGTGSGDFTKYGSFTGTNGYAWCAAFVSWCVKQAGVSIACVPKTASTLVMARKSNAYISWSNSTWNNLKRGDVIFFSTTTGLTDKYGNKKVHHVGIVTSVNKAAKRVEVVEGNTSSDKVLKRTYSVTNTGKITNYRGHFFSGYISVR